MSCTDLVWILMQTNEMYKPLFLGNLGNGNTDKIFMRVRFVISYFICGDGTVVMVFLKEFLF